MSRPRAATSVATRMCDLAALEVGQRARLRCAWLLSPWMAVALMPSALQLLGEPAGAVLGAREDERLLDRGPT